MMRARDLVVAMSGYGLFVSATAAQFAGYSTAVTQFAGDSRYGLATGDVDGDGDLDLVFTAFATDSFAVRLNDGSGVFVAGPTPFAGDGPRRLALADLDDDGDLDLAVALSNGNAVAVFVNDGAGNFMNAGTLSAGDGTWGVAIADIDGDGNQDLVATNENSSNLSIFIGNGAGGFASPVSVTVGIQPRWVGTADLDSDGDTDFVVSNTGGSSVSVLLNNGDMSFGQTFFSISGPGIPAIADFDNDGDLDLAVPSLDDVVIVLLNDGAGAFPAQIIGDPSIADPRAATAADVDGDNDLDILVVSSVADVVRVILNDGSANFTTHSDYAVTEFPVVVVSDDFDGNMSPDIAVSDGGGSGVSTLLNQTDVIPPGSFTLLSPPDGATGLPLPEAILAWPGATGTAPLKWDLATGFSNTYEVMIATDAALQSVVLQQSGITAPEFNVPTGVLELGTVYYWSVTAMNQAGQTVSSPGAFSFITAAPADFNGDGIIDGADLGLLLGAWGPVQ